MVVGIPSPAPLTVKSAFIAPTANPEQSISALPFATQLSPDKSLEYSKTNLSFPISYLARQ